MLTIRRAVFETNSSSTHSIIVADSGGLRGSLHCEDGIVEVEGKEFGWGPEIYTDAETKLSYLITRIFHKCVDNDGNINWKNVNKDWWIKVSKAVEDHTGCLLKVKTYTNEWHPIGYIDHQSIDVADDILNATVGKIKRFIFNPKSELLICNDNDPYWEDY